MLHVPATREKSWIIVCQYGELPRYIWHRQFVTPGKKRSITYFCRARITDCMTTKLCYLFVTKVCCVDLLKPSSVFDCRPVRRIESFAGPDLTNCPLSHFVFQLALLTRFITRLTRIRKQFVVHAWKRLITSKHTPSPNAPTKHVSSLTCSPNPTQTG